MGGRNVGGTLTFADFLGHADSPSKFITNYTHSSYALYHSGSQKSNLIILNLSNSKLHLFHFLFQEKKANNFLFVVPYSSSFLLLLPTTTTTLHMHFSGLCLRATQFSPPPSSLRPHSPCFPLRLLLRWARFSKPKIDEKFRLFLRYSWYTGTVYLSSSSPS